MPPHRNVPLGRMARRWLFLAHRWIGIASCLLFAMWLLSGLVMLYVPYPSLSPAARLARAEAIDWAAVDTPPPRGRMPRSLVLEMRDGRPVWRVGAWAGRDVIVSAARGVAPAAVDAAFVRRVAGRFAQEPVAAISLLTHDQWTVAGGFDRHRPLWKASIADPAGTGIYMSSITGDVVQRTQRVERFWNWLGSIPHWLYPTVIRQDDGAWRLVVLWVSGPCIAVAVTGMWIGLLRARWGARRYASGRVTPYRGWMLWHHVAGLVGGTFLLTWMVSGFLSVDPGRLFRRTEPDAGAVRRYAGGDGAMPTIVPAALPKVAAGAVQVRWTTFADTPRLTISFADGRRTVLDPVRLLPATTPLSQILVTAPGLVAHAPVQRIERLTAPDTYWHETAGRPPLPMWRLRFADPARTWLMVDPATGEIVATLDRRRRIYRWLFDMLHTWDLDALTRHRPARDLWLWLLSAAGLVTSVSGVWLGWKRLAR